MPSDLSGPKASVMDAQADLAALQKLNPQLAKDLAEVIKTGKEEDRFYGLSSKIRG
jgi:hypothetical protein